MALLFLIVPVEINGEEEKPAYRLPLTGIE
jgi:hypothetical protein